MRKERKKKKDTLVNGLGTEKGKERKGHDSVKVEERRKRGSFRRLVEKNKKDLLN